MKTTELTAEALEIRREYFRKWREAHREHTREYNKQWRANNPDKTREYQRRHWEKVADKGIELLSNSIGKEQA